MKRNFTRRTISMAMAAMLAIAPVQAMAAATDMTDHWAEKTVTAWQEQGLIKGYADGTFKPNNSITRAEFVTIMNNALGFETAGDISFTDVKENNWFYNAVATAAGAGYCSGYKDGSFKPNATITRAEAAVMIANALGLEANEGAVEGFTDMDAIPGWAMGSIGAVVEAGFMSGYPDASFGAKKSITRAEAVSSLNRAMAVEDEEAETPAEDEDTTETPVEGEGTTETPAEGEDTTETPAESEDTTEAPAEGEDTTETPAEGEDTTETPAESEDTTETPAEGEDTTEAPAEGEDTTETPVEGEDTTETPVESEATEEA